jgi:hypothetical protein
MVHHFVTEPEKLRWMRRALSAELILFCLAVALFAYIPPATFEFIEVVAVVGAALCSIGLFSQASNRLRLPGEQWAYLLTATLGVYVMLGFQTQSDASFEQRILIGVFLLSGIVGAYAAHLVDGGRRRNV